MHKASRNTKEKRKHHVLKIQASLMKSALVWYNEKQKPRNAQIPIFGRCSWQLKNGVLLTLSLMVLMPTLSLNDFISLGGLNGVQIRRKEEKSALSQNPIADGKVPYYTWQGLGTETFSRYKPTAGGRFTGIVCLDKAAAYCRR